MDRSFLSRPEVIAASRGFVCVRLATYEDADEMKYLRGLYVGGSGQVENTTFAVLAPDGKRELVRASRGPNHSFRDAAAMAERLNRIADGYEGQPEPGALPMIGDVRLGLNVAAADGVPLVVLLGGVDETAVTELAWSDAYRGRFAFARADAVEGVTGLKVAKGFVAVAPERFGRGGHAIAQGDDPAAVLKAALEAFEPHAREYREHIRDGKSEGVFWETRTPVTDPMEARARRR